jgi:hypothetical protein
MGFSDVQTGRKGQRHLRKSGRNGVKLQRTDHIGHRAMHSGLHGHAPPEMDMRWREWCQPSERESRLTLVLTWDPSTLKKVPLTWGYPPATDSSVSMIGGVGVGGPGTPGWGWMLCAWSCPRVWSPGYASQDQVLASRSSAPLTSPRPRVQVAGTWPALGPCVDQPPPPCAGVAACMLRSEQTTHLPIHHVACCPTCSLGTVEVGVLGIRHAAPCTRGAAVGPCVTAYRSSITGVCACVVCAAPPASHQYQPRSLMDVG